jgi:amino acid permease
MNDNNVKISSKERATYGALSTTYEEGSWEDDGSVETGATCTVFETTCNLVSVLTGSGMLSLPYAAAQAGWSSLVILVVLCSIFLYSFELLATSIETFYTRENASLTRTKPISYYNIDYLSFGILSFGQYGDRIVLVIFGAEVSLALVSFLMNIGINIHVINPSISVSTGILISAGLTCIMSFWNLKTVALSSVVGLALTTLTVVAIFASGLHLHDEAMLATREYKMLNLTGVPVALGLIAFCFGGHGTL